MSTQLCTHEPVNDNDNNNNEVDEDEVVFDINQNNSTDNHNTNTDNAMHNNYNSANNACIINTIIISSGGSGFSNTMQSTTSPQPSQHPLSISQVKQNEQDDSIQMSKLVYVNNTNNKNALNINHNDNCNNANRVSCTSITCDSE